MDAQQIDRAYELRAKRWVPWRIARELKVPVEDVRAALRVVAQRRHDITKEQEAQAREMVRGGMTRYATAKALDLDHHVVGRVCRDLVAPVPLILRERKRRVGTNGQENHPGQRRTCRRFKMPEDDIEVPGWVPEKFSDIYLNVATRDGEEIAASLCRKLKAGGAVRCA